MKIKWIIISVIVIIFTIAIFLIFIKNANIDTEKVFSKYCNQTDKGFKCILEENQAKKISIINQKCNASSGKWFRGSECSGPCIKTDEYFCHYPYNDGGNTCKNIADCEGLCIYNYKMGMKLFKEQNESYILDCPNCTGTCEKYPRADPKCCYFDLNDSKAYYHIVYY